MFSVSVVVDFMGSLGCCGIMFEDDDVGIEV